MPYNLEIGIFVFRRQILNADFPYQLVHIIVSLEISIQKKKIIFSYHRVKSSDAGFINYKTKFQDLAIESLFRNKIHSTLKLEWFKMAINKNLRELLVSSFKYWWKFLNLNIPKVYIGKMWLRLISYFLFRTVALKIIYDQNCLANCFIEREIQ